MSSKKPERVGGMIKALFRMSRPDQLVAVAMVYALGNILALTDASEIHMRRALWGWAALLFVAASIHFANEYADYETDRLTQRTLFSGGSGALQESGVSPRLALYAAWGSLLVGTLIAFLGWGLGFQHTASLGVLIFGAFFGWMYSLPPLKLAWNGWGEIDNALLGGVLLPVYGYAVQSGRLDWFAVAASIPFGMLAFINLLATTWADRKADLAVGKFTLATRWSISQLRRLYIGVAISAFGALFLLPIFPRIVVMSSLLSLPVVIWGALTYTRWHNPLPTVAAMITMLVGQMLSWLVVLW